MEGCGKLGAAGSAAASQPLIRTCVLLFLLGCGFLSAPALSPDPLATAKQFAEEQRWAEIVRLVEAEPTPSADLNYYYGIALSQLGRYDEAGRALLSGYRLEPADKRFPTELAGVEFKQKHYSEAAKWLHRALSLDPADAYAKNFLGTVYFLNDNLEAALKYWNEVERPQIETLRLAPKPRTDPVLLDRAFAFAPASKLRLEDLLTTQARISALDIFPSYRIELAARDDGKFDGIFRAQERNGWGLNMWMGLVSFFRGVFYETVYPEYFNLRSSGTNAVSLVRWDAQKRRLMASLSGPWKRDPKWRYQLGTDLRNENWDLRSSSANDAAQFAALNLRQQRVGAAITRIMSGRRSWSAGAELSHRDFRDFVLTAPPSPGEFPAGMFSQGYQLKQITGLNYELWRVPEKRFTLTAGAASELARLWSEPSQSFAKLQTSLNAHWLPQARGDDYEINQGLRAGHTFGDSPFDELFMLGIERDNDLWLRAHVGTHDGRKGSAPLGRSYFLSNWDLSKNIYSHPLFKFRLGPFVDAGKIFEPSPGLATNKWLWDTGAQAKVQVLGVGVVFVYGKDLRTGNNAFYATVGR
jgi:tetratricopeptide (TPR) repeat protein